MVLLRRERVLRGVLLGRDLLDLRLALHGAGDRELRGFVVVLVNLVVIFGVLVNEDAADNHQVLGVLRRNDTGSDAVVRLMAFVVAPGMAAAALHTALKERIDTTFLPRPLVMLDALPRNATGKLPREVLQAMARTHLGLPVEEGLLRAE